MSSEIEQRIHKALEGHPLERTADGYRLVHPGGAGVSTLRIRPVTDPPNGAEVVAVAEIVAEHSTAGLGAFHPVGLQRLNALSVHGAYRLEGARLFQTAQLSIYPQEPSVHLVVQTILNAFGSQLPLGRSMALATNSAAMLEAQRAHHNMPRAWATPIDAAVLQLGTTMLHERGLAASSNETSLWAELALSGEVPSRAIDPNAETALLQVNTNIAHPIAGAGYLATLALPWPVAPVNAADICRRLNELELEQVDMVPRIGAWGLNGQDDMPMYSLFYPAPEQRGELHMILIWWLVVRALWLRERFWLPGQGLHVEALMGGAGKPAKA